eukprot:10205531-Ditylum_brightwellii.AAC.1
MRETLSAPAPPPRVQRKVQQEQDLQQTSPAQTRVEKDVPTYMSIIQKKLDERKMQNKGPKKKVHVILEDAPRGRRKSSRLHPLPPPCPHPISIPTPKESCLKYYIGTGRSLP